MGIIGIGSSSVFFQANKKIFEETCKKKKRKFLDFLFVIGVLTVLLTLVPSFSFYGHPLGVLSWETKAPIIPVGGVGVEGAAAGLINGKIYISHGFGAGDTNALRIYDIVTDTWKLGASAKFARSEIGGAVVDGKFFVIGGRDLRTGSLMEIYDSMRNRWMAGKPMPTARSGFGIVALDGKIHVIGGRDGNAPQTGKALDVHEIFNSKLNKWFKRAPLPIAVMDNYSMVVIDNKIYVFGGFDGEKARATTQIYDGATDTWALGAPMPTERSSAIAGILAGHPIVIGGLAASDPTQNLDIVEIYHPDSDSWTKGPAKPTPASEMASAAPNLSNAIYTIGSGAFGLSQTTNEVLTLRECAGGRDVGISWARPERLSPSVVDLFLGVNNLGCESVKATVRVRAVPPLRISPTSMRFSLKESARKIRFAISKIDPNQTYELKACATLLRDTNSANDCITVKISLLPLPLPDSIEEQNFDSLLNSLEIQNAWGRVQLFSLGGRLLLDEVGEPRSLGASLARFSEMRRVNGVYLAVITARDIQENRVRRHVKKLVVLKK